MRVYIINANWGKGGPGGIAADLYAVLEKNGHSCRFAYARGITPTNINAFKFSSKPEVYIHALSARLFDNAGFMSHLATKALIKDIESFSPDIISIHNPLGYTIHIKILMDYIRSRAIPTCWTLHDCWLFTGHCTTDICPQLNAGCGHCPHKKDFPTSWFFDFSRNNLRKKEKFFSNIKNLSFVAPSDWIANLAKKSYLKNNKIFTINNGIDLGEFTPIESNLRNQFKLNGKCVILSVASVWSKRKGGTYIYQLSEMMDDRYAFVMIGRNSDRDLKENQRIIHIEYTGSRKELAQWYTLADIFINPTLGDNFPTVNLEALACGTPIVTFDTGGSGEMVGTCGTVVPQGNIHALKKGIEDCLNQKITPEMCIRQSQKYDKEKRYMDYIELFEKITKSN